MHNEGSLSGFLTYPLQMWEFAVWSPQNLLLSRLEKQRIKLQPLLFNPCGEHQAQGLHGQGRVVGTVVIITQPKIVERS